MILWTTLGPASTYFSNDVVVCRRRVGQNRSDSRQSLLAADMSSLQGYVDRRVFLVLQDGRAIVGILAGFDQKSNIVLSDCKERVFSMDDGVEEIPLGLYLVKGDMIILIGELDEAIDNSTDLPSIRADPILPIRY